MQEGDQMRASSFVDSVFWLVLQPYVTPILVCCSSFIDILKGIHLLLSK